KVYDLINKEFYTLIISVNITSKRIPAYLIFKTDLIKDYIYINLNNSTRFI
ncbi:hypothetical protein QBC46DRAFT_253093, partial [Diplogelasinospora grovesii]